MSEKEWRERRRHGIGGSDVAAIMGLSPFATPLDVWLEKTGRTPDEDEEEEESDSERKQKERGNILEPAVANWYAKETGVRVVELPREELPLRGPDLWMTGSPDRLVTASDNTLFSGPLDVLRDGEAWGMEAKTARDMKGWGDTGTDLIPPYYMLQCVWYMAITGKDRWDVAVYFPFYDEFRHYTLTRNRDIEEHVVNTVGAWREKHVVRGIEPDMGPQKAHTDWLLEKYRVPVLPDREATDEEVRLAQELALVAAQRKALETQEDLLKNQLRATIGEHRGIKLPFGTILWSPVKGRLGIDRKKLESEYPDVYAAVKKEGKPSRQFRSNFKEN